MARPCRPRPVDGIFTAALDGPGMREFAGDPPVEEHVGDLLRERTESVAVVEGATGGVVAALLTSVPGASEYVDRGLVPYDYDALRDLLAVPRETLDEHGAVSKPTARATARAARDTADVTWGLATTGVAGPGGGTAEMPLGTGFVGVAHAAPWGSGDSGVTVARYQFEGTRGAIRERLARQALEDLSDTIAARD
jgi:nicotinamide-nucleotide amidase